MPTIKASDLPPELADKLGLTPAKANKHKVAKKSKRTKRGKVYGSVAEMDYADMLYFEQQSGLVTVLIEQPRLWLGVPENVYKPDFFITTSTGDIRFIDVKGHATAKFKRDVKLWRQYGPCKLSIVMRGRKGKGWTYETITPDVRR